MRTPSPLSRSSRMLALAMMLCSVAAGTRAEAVDLGFGEDGLHAEIKGMGNFGLSWPRLENASGGAGKTPVQKKIAGAHAELTYAGDAGLTMDIEKGGKISLRFRNLPADAQRFHMTVMIGSEYGDGGTWKFDGGEAKGFPKDKPAKPFLYQGNASTFALADTAGHAISFAVPEHSFHQLQDNREWGWKIFQWQVWVPINRGWEVHPLAITELLAAGGKVQPQVDRFGQTTRKEFPGKVKDEAELKADVAAETAYYAGLSPLPVDSWGGLKDSGAKLGLKATGFFHVEQHGGRWLLADPDGNAFFHLGLCSFGFVEDPTYVKDREDIYEWLPPTSGEFANAWQPDQYWHDKAFSFYLANVGRKYGSIDREQQLGRLVERVRRMGFNSVGAFSGNNPAFTAAHIPRMEMVGMEPELPGIRGVPDPFDDTTRKHFDEQCARQVAANAKDPLVIGYFFANEQAFEDIPRVVPQLDGKHAAKRRLVESLRKEYPTIAAFNAAWGTQAADFAALADLGLPVATQQAFADMRDYTALFLDAYYSAITSTFRKYDQDHLMIGNRWQPGTANSEVLCRTAGKYMDVISINYYTLGVDAAFMKRIHDWSGGKAQMWSEFYYTSGDESNVAAGNGDMKTQRQRGQAYRNYVEAGASLGFVVGIEWFTLLDQAVTGRWFSKLSGERANTGVFNVADRPYKDMVAEMAAAHRDVYDVWLDGKAPYQFDDPRFAGGSGKGRKSLSAGHTTGTVAMDGSVTGWPGRPPERIGSDRLVIGQDGKGLEATFKVCWDEKNLYLLANVTDPTPMNNGEQGDMLWNGDGLELFIGGEQIDEPGALRFSDHQLLLGARKGGAFHLLKAAAQPAVAMTVVPSVDGSGYTLEAAIPWTALGVAPKESTTLLFDLAVDDAPAGGQRTRQLMWNGGQRNSSDRSAWGRLQLVP